MKVQITRYIIVEQDEPIIFTGFFSDSINREAQFMVKSLLRFWFRPDTKSQATSLALVTHDIVESLHG